SEKTQKRNRKMHESQINDAQDRFEKAKEKIEILHDIKINISQQKIVDNKLLLKVENVSYNYPEEKTLLENINLTLCGPSRIAINGDNGSGNTTLIQLILG